MTTTPHDATVYSYPGWSTPEETADAVEAFDEESRVEYERSTQSTREQYLGLTGQGPEPLSLSSISPTTATNAADVNITCIGTGFTEECSGYVGGAESATTFVSDTELTVLGGFMGAGANTYDVTVMRGTEESNALPFVVTAAQEEPEPEDTPTMEWLKADIIAWIETSDIEIGDLNLGNMTKAELLELIYGTPA